MKTKCNLVSSMVSVVAAALLLASSAHKANAGSLIWADDFDGANGSAPDSANWSYNTGGGGWGNNELQIYTTSTNNSYITTDPDADDGKCLQIKCTTSNGLWNGQWYSARLHSNGKRMLVPGRIAAFRTRCPKGGQGYWPANWMLGTVGGTWPACGEIDIMEQINGQNTIYQTLHMPGWDPSVANNVPDSNSWFRTSMAWAADGSYIKFYLNDVERATFTRAGTPGGATWEFNTNNRFYFLINVAMGGNWPGNPNSSTEVGKGMRVDYCRYAYYP